MDRDTWHPDEFKRLHESTPNLVPSTMWLEELVRNGEAVVKAIYAYVGDLAGKPYNAGIRGNTAGKGGSVPWVYTYSQLECSARRLESQLNPDSSPRNPVLVFGDDDDEGFYGPKRGDAISEIKGWGLDLGNPLRRDVVWLLAYTADLQDVFDWLKHSEEKVVVYGLNEEKREVYETMDFVCIPYGSNTFVWPVVPESLRFGLSECVERLKEFSQVNRSPVRRLEVDLKRSRVRVEDTWHPVSAIQADIVEALIAADGEEISLAESDWRTRDIENMPPEVRKLIHKKPGKGTWIPKIQIWFS